MVSVIIPVYNVEKYIRKCLESVINQTYKNLEIIIINDGSTDNSHNIIIKYAEKDDRIKYIYQENKGVSYTRNLALKHSNGEYVIFLDSDDYIDETFIEKLYNNAKKNNSDIVICGHIRFYEDNYSKKEIFDYNGYDKKIYNGDEILNLILTLKVKGYLCDKLFKRENLIKNSFYLEEGRYIEDWLPVIKSIIKAKYITFVSEPLYYYRQREASALHTINKKLLEDYIYTVNNINEYLECKNIKYNKCCKNVFDSEVFYSIVRYFYIIHIREYKYGFKVYKSFEKYIKDKNINLKISYVFNTKLSFKVKIKIILWKLKIFHFFYKVS